MSAFQIKFLAFRVYRFGDTKAFHELHTLYYERVKRFVSFKVARDEDAEELANEVFLRAWEYMSAQKVDNVMAFLYRLARNLIADHYRRGKTTEPLTPEIENTVAAEGSLVDEAATHEEAEDLLKRMRSLKEEYRVALAMRYQDEMSTAEIAQALDKKVSAVRVLLYRAKQALKKTV